MSDGKSASDIAKQLTGIVKGMAQGLVDPTGSIKQLEGDNSKLAGVYNSIVWTDQASKLGIGVINKTLGNYMGKAGADLSKSMEEDLGDFFDSPIFEDLIGDIADGVTSLLSSLSVEASMEAIFAPIPGADIVATAVIMTLMAIQIQGMIIDLIGGWLTGCKYSDNTQDYFDKAQVIINQLQYQCFLHSIRLNGGTELPPVNIKPKFQPIMYLSSDNPDPSGTDSDEYKKNHDDVINGMKKYYQDNGYDPNLDKSSVSLLDLYDITYELYIKKQKRLKEELINGYQKYNKDLEIVNNIFDTGISTLGIFIMIILVFCIAFFMYRIINDPKNRNVKNIGPCSISFSMVIGLIILFVSV